MSLYARYIEWKGTHDGTRVSLMIASAARVGGAAHGSGTTAGGATSIRIARSLPGKRLDGATDALRHLHPEVDDEGLDRVHSEPAPSRGPHCRSATMTAATRARNRRVQLPSECPTRAPKLANPFLSRKARLEAHADVLPVTTMTSRPALWDSRAYKRHGELLEPPESNQGHVH